MSYTYNEGPKVKNQMEIDHKIVKRIYPRTNNQTSLEFVAEKDPNLCLRLYSCKLMVAIKYPGDYCADIGIACKLFNDLRIDFDSQTINSTTAQYVSLFEFFILNLILGASFLYITF